MQIKVVEERILTVPKNLESEVRGAIELKDSAYLEELLGDLEDHNMAVAVRTISVEENV